MIKIFLVQEKSGYVVGAYRDVLKAQEVQARYPGSRIVTLWLHEE